MCAIKQNIHGKLRVDIVFFEIWILAKFCNLAKGFVSKQRYVALVANYSWPRVMV